MEESHVEKRLPAQLNSRSNVYLNFCYKEKEIYFCFLKAEYKNILSILSPDTYREEKIRFCYPDKKLTCKKSWYKFLIFFKDVTDPDKSFSKKFYKQFLFFNF